MSNVTVRQAAFLTGKSRETINTACNDGKISSSRNEQGVRVIDVAELARVYPLKKKMDELDQSERASEPVRDSQILTNPGPSDLREQIAALRERVEGLAGTNELLKSERERERRQFEAEIENLRLSLEKTQASLEKAQENQSRAMLMLTDQSEGVKEKDRRQEQKVLELSATVEQLKQQNKRIYRALKERQEKEAAAARGFWQRLFA